MTDNTNTPLSVQLLFDNEKLELLKILTLLHVFSKRGARKRKIDELIFYYSLVNYKFYKYFNERGLALKKSYSTTLYFRFEKKSKIIFLKLYNLGFVEIEGDITSNYEDLKIKITQKGVNFFKKYQTNFTSTLSENYEGVIDSIKYSKTNVKKIKGTE